MALIPLEAKIKSLSEFEIPYLDPRDKKNSSPTLTYPNIWTEALNNSLLQRPGGLKNQQKCSLNWYKPLSWIKLLWVQGHIVDKTNIFQRTAPMKILITLLLLANLVGISNAMAYTFKFTEKQLQDQVSAMMPITRKKYMVTVTVSNPRLHLLKEGNLISTKADIVATIPGGLKASGTTRITGTISYNREKGSFHLKNPKIETMHINGLPKKMHGTVRNLAQNGLVRTMHKRPLFKLKDDNLKHKLAKATLKSVEVKQGVLHVELGML